MVVKQKQARVEAYIERVWPQVVKDLGRLVAIDSVENLEHAQPGSPYGPGPAAALEAGEAIAKRLGLDAKNDEGYIVIADLAGKSEKQIAVLAHLDIVPAGDGWHGDPFKLAQRDGYLIGRGVMDDKGPAVISLYAARYFVEQVEERGEKLPYTLRLLLGGNEESGFRDVEYYNAHYDPPAFLFTPDGWWPVCIGEKGVATATITTPHIGNGKIVEFYAGEAVNVIPPTATAVVKADISKLPEVRGIDIQQEGEGLVRLFARGIGGHAAMPEGSKNPIGMLIHYLLDQKLYSDSEKPFLDLEALVFSGTDGKALGIDATDDLFDPLTCIGGTIRKDGNRFVQTLNIRFPKSVDGDFLTQNLQTTAAMYSCLVALDVEDGPYWINPNLPEIKVLCDIYNEHTGKDAKPFTMGGGTYARHFPRATSFGPEDPDAKLPAWVGVVHTPNEAVSEQLLKDSLAIYIDAIERLMQLDW